MKTAAATSLGIIFFSALVYFEADEIFPGQSLVVCLAAVVGLAGAATTLGERKVERLGEMAQAAAVAVLLFISTFGDVF